MRIYYLLTMLGVLLSGRALMAEPVVDIRVPLSADLQADALLAHDRGVPFLVMFSLDHCPYCMVVREEFLDPMQRNSDYRDKVLMRILKMDEGYVTDFDGARIAVDELALRYGASVAPTIVLLDQHGKLLTERLLGLTTPDLYGGYLDDAIEQSLQRLYEQRMLNWQ